MAEQKQIQKKFFLLFLRKPQRNLSFVILLMPISLVFTSDISINKITKDKFSSEVYEDKAKRIFF